MEMVILIVALLIAVMFALLSFGEHVSQLKMSSASWRRLLSTGVSLSLVVVGIYILYVLAVSFIQKQ